jgi:hypothetical protein
LDGRCHCRAGWTGPTCLVSLTTFIYLIYLYLSNYPGWCVVLCYISHLITRTTNLTGMQRSGSLTSSLICLAPYWWHLLLFVWPL